jgi:hypothetical protein
MSNRFAGRRPRGESGKVQPDPQTADVAPPAPVDMPQADDAGLAADVVSAMSSAQGDIPPHVWALLQQAGEAAAQRLVDILKGPGFVRFSPQAQRALIDLALTRAYGLPVRKAVSVTLNTNDADAVARSLLDLSDSLPETARKPLRDVTPPEGAISPGKGV